MGLVAARVQPGVARPAADTHTGGIGRNRDVQTGGARAAGRRGDDDGGGPEFRSRGGRGAAVAAAVSAVSRGSAPGFHARFPDAFSKRGSVSRSRAPGSRAHSTNPGNLSVSLPDPNRRRPAGGPESDPNRRPNPRDRAAGSRRRRRFRFPRARRRFRGFRRRRRFRSREQHGHVAHGAHVPDRHDVRQQGVRVGRESVQWGRNTRGPSTAAIGAGRNSAGLATGTTRSGPRRMAGSAATIRIQTTIRIRTIRSAIRSATCPRRRAAPPAGFGSFGGHHGAPPRRVNRRRRRTRSEQTPGSEQSRRPRLRPRLRLRLRLRLRRR